MSSRQPGHRRAFLGNAPTCVQLPAGDRPEATWESLLRRGGEQGDSQGDRDGAEASVSGDIAQQPGESRGQGGLKDSSGLGSYSHRLSLINSEQMLEEGLQGMQSRQALNG